MILFCTQEALPGRSSRCEISRRQDSGNRRPSSKHLSPPILCTGKRPVVGLLSRTSEDASFLPNLTRHTNSLNNKFRSRPKLLPAPACPCLANAKEQKAIHAHLASSRSHVPVERYVRWVAICSKKTKDVHKSEFRCWLNLAAAELKRGNFEETRTLTNIFREKTPTVWAQTYSLPCPISAASAQRRQRLGG